MDLTKSLAIAFAGMTAQSKRLRVVAENLANAESTSQQPGGEPYRRKVVSFRQAFDRAQGINTVQVGRIGPAGGEFGRHYDPANPAADAQGYVLTPDVNPLVELMDMRDAQRSYQANLSVIDAARQMLGRTIDLLRG
jgi:flagellar basal-body rod protein FlgC